jgi:putative ABC transport system permease protein
VNELMKEGGRGNAGSRRARWLTGTMVVVELALTLVLLVGAGLMVRSFMAIYTSDLGIPAEHLMSMRLQLPAAKYKTAGERMVFYDRLSPRLAALAGVESAAVSTGVPGFGAWVRRMEVDGRPPKTRFEEYAQVSTMVVDPQFFGTTGIDIRRGRPFSDADGKAGLEVAIVSERFVTEHLPGEDPIGRRIRFPAPPSATGPAPNWLTIVGVSRALPETRDLDRQPPSLVYVPIRQEAPASASLLVRSRLDPGAVMNAVRQEVASIDPDQPVFTVQTVEQMQAQATWPYRVFGSLFALFALIALVLSAVGLYAVMAYSVTQRTQEIGVRMALGAKQGQVLWLVFKRGLLQLAIGLSIGLLGAYGLSRVLSPLLASGVTATDPLTFASIAAMLTIVGLAASLVPARRATRVDPLVALRE